MNIENYLSDFITQQHQKDPAQKVFHQAVEEVLCTLKPVLERKPVYIKEKIL